MLTVTTFHKNIFRLVSFDLIIYLYICFCFSVNFMITEFVCTCKHFVCLKPQIPGQPFRASVLLDILVLLRLTRECINSSNSPILSRCVTLVPRPMLGEIIGKKDLQSEEVVTRVQVSILTQNIFISVD